MPTDCAGLRDILLNYKVNDSSRDAFIEALKKFLGPKLYKLSLDKGELAKDKDIDRRAKELSSFLKVSEPLTVDQNLNSLVYGAKLVLAKEEAIKKIQSIQKYENLTASDFDYLASFFGDNKKFCATHGLNSQHNHVNNMLEELKTSVKERIENLKTEVLEEKNKYVRIGYENIIDVITTDIDRVLQLIYAKSQNLRDKKYQLEIQLKKQRGTILRDSKKSTQEAIDKLNAEINILDISDKKLLLVKDRLNKRIDTLGKITSAFDSLNNSIDNIANPKNKFIDPQIPANIINDLNEDLDRCRRILHLGKITADDPGKQLNAKSPVNTFVEVMSLADIHESSQSGKAYFREEIIDASTQKTKLEKDPRVLYGLESNIITRGIKLQPGEIKRTSYVVNGDAPKMYIDTKIVRAAKNDKYNVAKCNFTATAKLTEVEMQIGAFRYAKDLLRQHALGDPNSKIIVKSGKGKNAKDAKELASYVYAALLMLTSADEYGEKIYNISRDKIIVDVSGMERPAYCKWQLPWNKTKNFIENKYTGFANEVANFKKEIEVLNLNKQDKQSSIDENAAASDASYRPK